MTSHLFQYLAGDGGEGGGHSGSGAGSHGDETSLRRSIHSRETTTLTNFRKRHYHGTLRDDALTLSALHGHGLSSRGFRTASDIYHIPETGRCGHHIYRVFTIGCSGGSRRFPIGSGSAAFPVHIAYARLADLR